MNSPTTRFFFFSLIAALAMSSQAAAQMHASSVPGIEVAEGFDAQIVSQGMLSPFGMALDTADNIVVGSNCVMCPALRLNHDGTVIGASNWIIDPDGVAVDSAGRVLVAGDRAITVMNSFVPPGVDVMLAGGFSNLNDIVIHGSGDIFVYDSNGQIWQVSPTGVVSPAPLTTTALGAGIGLDPIEGGLLATTGPPDDLVLAIALDGTVTEIAAMPTFSAPGDAEQATGGSFGDWIYVTLGATGEIVTVDRETGAEELFARGFTRPARLVFEGQNGLLVSDIDAGRIIRIFPVAPEFIEVQIDIKPGGERNCFNPDGHGVLPIVIYGSADIDVGEIDYRSLSLEGLTVATLARSNKLMIHYELVNDDEYVDARVHFRDNGLWTGDGDMATLTGMMNDETPIEGSDHICIVPDPSASSSRSVLSVRSSSPSR